MHPAPLPAASAHDLLADAGFRVSDEVALPARRARMLPIPSALHPRVREVLARLYPHGLYHHQALALQALLHGGDVCLSTPTASGKTLVFLVYAAHLRLTRPQAKVLALYPARALIRDQLDAWSAFLSELGLSACIVDGGVPMAERAGLVQRADVVLMTPDVAHAWLLGKVRERAPRAFLAAMGLLVLDEAHTYSGAFGTHAAHLMRRLRALAGAHQIVTSTATLSDAPTFVEALTGRTAQCIGADDDGSEAPTKRMLVVESAKSTDAFECATALVRKLAAGTMGRFLVFADSRKVVELTVAAVRRGGRAANEVAPEDEIEETEVGQLLVEVGGARVLPYRAGYEEDDRVAIQRALSEGRLAGVVATSALELGIDIGAIACVVMLAPPPSMKSFWQRFGRAGRRSTPGLCVLIDPEQLVARAGGAEAWLARPIEPSRLYLENRFIQYAQALCTAAEIADVGRGNVSLEAFGSLPDGFCAALENELDPKVAVPQDLYALKQRAQATPHYEFPIRAATEKMFSIHLRGTDTPLGKVSHGQMLREAYPGAIYYYMARPYRVVRVDERSGKIEAQRAQFVTTRPNAQTMVFPRFANGTLQLRRSGSGFACESEVQVSERVVGFVEARGKTKHDHPYGPQSTYAQRPLQWFFETTAACWFDPSGAGATERSALLIRSAFCHRFGIQDQDVGVGLFHAQSGPSSVDGVVKGYCIYDATNGSLRLTSILVAHFAEVVEDAIGAARQAGDADSLSELQRLHDLARGWLPVEVDAVEPTPARSGDVVEIVAPGETAMYLGGAGPEEVHVVGVLFTAAGLLYEVEPPTRDSKRRIGAAHVVPLAGRTRMALFDTRTLEVLREAS